MKGVLGRLIPAAAGLVLGAGGLLGVTVAFGGSLPFAATRADPTPVVQLERHGVLYPTRERIVNLADPGILRYLKTTIVLEVFDPENPTGAHSAGGGDHGKPGKVELPKDLHGKGAVIEDKITSILSARTAADLMTAEGKQRLKDDLRDGLNKALHQDRILAVYFTDFIIQ